MISEINLESEVVSNVKVDTGVTVQVNKTLFYNINQILIHSHETSGIQSSQVHFVNPFCCLVHIPVST